MKISLRNKFCRNALVARSKCKLGFIILYQGFMFSLCWWFSQIISSSELNFLIFYFFLFWFRNGGKRWVGTFCRIAARQSGVSSVHSGGGISRVIWFLFYTFDLSFIFAKYYSIIILMQLMLVSRQFFLNSHPTAWRLRNSTCTCHVWNGSIGTERCEPNNVNRKMLIRFAESNPAVFNRKNHLNGHTQQGFCLFWCHFSFKVYIRLRSCVRQSRNFFPPRKKPG